MYLAVDERVEAEHEWVLVVLVWGFALHQHLARRREKTVIPVVIHEPLGGYQLAFYLFGRNSCGLGLRPALFVHCVHKLSLILCFALEHLAVQLVYAVVARLALLVPHLYHAAAVRVLRNEKRGVDVPSIAELLRRLRQIVLVGGVVVHLPQLLYVAGLLGEVRQQVTPGHVVYLADERAVPASHVPHAGIDEEVVRLYLRGPAVQPVAHVAERLPATGETAYYEVLEDVRVYRLAFVDVVNIFQQLRQTVAHRLFVPVPRYAYRLGVLVYIQTFDGIHQLADKIVLKRYAALPLYHHTFLHPSAALVLYLVAPLVAVGVVKATPALPAELVKVVPAIFRLQQNIVCVSVFRHKTGC